MRKRMKFAKQTMFQKSNKGQKGITLIALVITIIVLLILAGVTIALLSGDNSAPQKATEAAQKDAIAGAKDEIAMAVQERLLNYYNNTYVKGNVTGGASTRGEVADAAYDAVENAKKRNSQLSNSSKVYGNTIVLRTKSFIAEGKIETNGGITWSNTVASTEGALTNAEKAEKINDAIGQTVDYTDQDDNSNSGGWRVFYASESEMFLISTKVISFKVIPITGYTNSDDVFNPKNPETNSDYSYSDVTYGAEYNEKWKTKLGETSNTYANSKATAYLCDPTNWTEYISPTVPKGTYAVGGPTKELFLLSWNESYKNGKLKDEKEEQLLTEDDVSTSGYDYKKPKHLYEDKPITKEMLNGLYNPGVSYWLASPGSNNDTDDVCVIMNSGYMSNHCYYYGYGVRPIVSVPISNVQIEENGTVKIE